MKFNSLDSKSKLVFYLAFASAFILVIVIILTTISMGYTPYPLYYPLSIHDHQSLTPIFKIEKKNSNSNTNIRNSANSFISSWPGTVAGCDCLNVTSDKIKSKYRNKLLRMQCTPDLKNYCTDVQNINEINITKIKGTEGQLIRREFDNTFSYDYLIEHSGENCPSNYTECGILDTKGNKMCISKDSQIPCPINKLVIKKKDEAPVDLNYEKIELDDDYVGYYTNENISGKIIVDGVLSEGTPCINPIEKNSNNLGNRYILDVDYYNITACKNNTKGSPVFTNTDYDLIFDFSKESLYKDNGIVDAIKNRELPLYPESSLSETTISLFSRNYVGVSHGCGLNLVQSSKGKLENVYSQLLFFTAGSIVGKMLIVYLFYIDKLYCPSMKLIKTLQSRYGIGVYLEGAMTISIGVYSLCLYLENLQFPVSESDIDDITNHFYKTVVNPFINPVTRIHYLIVFGSGFNLVMRIASIINISLKYIEQNAYLKMINDDYDQYQDNDDIEEIGGGVGDRDDL